LNYDKEYNSQTKPRTNRRLPAYHRLKNTALDYGSFLC
jgi:hypothetical protein